MANRSSNKAAVPEAKGALDKFKYEVATELGVAAVFTVISVISENKVISIPKLYRIICDSRIVHI